ncbi:MAG: hypothetical protein COV67_01705 [Nitrospinae bacterium CG11_big_fil_rev_8_21_14_0_20_56_8]|nr:MAG: hypothetical protein COV67_01705 [Nitrospinae bacterium CG11_big_fil_rev_8_21_14_0_20_56_8]
MDAKFPPRFKIVTGLALALLLAGGALINRFSTGDAFPDLVPPINAPDEAGRSIQQASEDFFFHDFDQALAHYRKAIALFEAEKNFIRAADTYESIGDLHKFFHHLKEAEDSYIFAAHYHHRIGNPTGEGKAMKNVGDLHWANEEETDLAETWYVKAVTAVQGKTPSRVQGEIYEGLGRIYWKKAQLPQAIEYIGKARDTFASLNYQMGYDHMTSLLATLKKNKKFPGPAYIPPAGKSATHQPPRAP